ncbi:uncharacterized protein BJX67DRAFT_355961 [Aspergillus lucknowensis]|uniref:Serine-threonine/tyrosine-protein kinase catalytic domain-containing protein n=1 Tax=Aspergillus lucknowensis TaxID=176173 RepID=A0ABR4LNT1_9EURO
MEFPEFDGNPPIDDIIDKCWHNKYATVSELAAHTRKLLRESTDTAENNGVVSREERRKEEELRAPSKPAPEEGFTTKKAICQDLEKRGLLHVLSSGEPEQLGFTFDWYRHSL